MLSDEVAKALKDDIIRGVYRPSQKLLLADLKDRYQTGTSPVREALFRLESSGFLRLEAQKGFTVTPISARDCEDLYSTRVLLEKEALSQSLKYGDDDWEGELVSAHHHLHKVESAPETIRYATWEKRHNHFHQVLTSACPSQYLCHMVDNFRDLTERYRVIWLKSARYDSSFEQAAADHQAIFEAALARDVQQIQQLISKHFQYVVERIKKVIIEVKKHRPT